ncbi:ABC transporter permease [Nanoarchaeota archaeon]
MLWDYFLIAIRTLKRQKMRTYLTMIGIIIGIAAVISLISISQGMKDSITEQFEMLGVNTMMVTPTGGLFGIGAEGNELTQEDIDTIRNIPNIDQVSGMTFKIGKIEFQKEIKYTFIIGMETTKDSLSFFDTFATFRIQEGRSLKPGDKHKVTLGSRLCENNVFKKNIKVKDKIEIEGQRFDVVGCYQSVGSQTDDEQVYIPMETAMELFDIEDEFTLVYIRAEKGSDMGFVKEKVEDKLRKLRDVAKGEEDFSVQTTEEMLRSFDDILNVVQIIVIGIALISLIVGGIGIMNTMYTSVLERTPEIGTMKAVGAKNSDILLIFLVESGLLGLIGGGIGALIGIGFGKLVEFGAAAGGMSALLKVSISPTLIIGALSFSFIIGMISGILPAWKAAKMKPVDALRYE